MDFGGQTGENDLNCLVVEKSDLRPDYGDFIARNIFDVANAPVAQLDRASVYGTEG